MFYPDKETFLKLCKQGNVVPVYAETLADFDTPLSCFLKTKEGAFSFLLESVEGGEHLARYSFIGHDPLLVVASKGKEVTLLENNSKRTFMCHKDPVAELKTIMDKFKFVQLEGLPRFCGGLVGYIGYDIVRFFEDIPDKNQSGVNIPDMQFVLSDTMIVFDHVDHKIKIISNCVVGDDPRNNYEKACEKIKKVMAKLGKPLEYPELVSSVNAGTKAVSNFSKEEFCDLVEKAKEHIRAGDIIQMVPSQRLMRKTSADAFTIYRALRSVNPSPYMFYLDFDDKQIIGSSPEILVRCEDRQVELRPIAGTRRRGKNIEEDVHLEMELLADPKECAEHIMLVDLGRNDIGRVCKFATVKTEDVMHIERYSHVMHIVSNVVGELEDDKDIYDLIRATFPAGTVTGAPKVKAMELIDKFENTRRGLYAGSVGYISFSGNTDLCIAIRTILMITDTAYVQVGAGIVLDSDPVKEYEETLNKAQGMMKAIDFAERGLK
ncbi:MAG: anthranilate synthase component I [Candidatus Omnitrophica bacterium]|nr:anthranilate synthase component I [Candidatus Omnitrophota bacterium]